MREQRLILVGNPGTAHVGAHLHRGALESGYSVYFLNSEEAFRGPGLIKKLNWWIRGRLPSRLHEFSETVLRTCREFRPDFILSTGIAPISEDALRSISAFGIRRLNYLTDDPWNPRHMAPWFIRALSQYDHVFSPRRANLEDLSKLEGPSISYLPFAYAPEIHFGDPPTNDEEKALFTSDVVFAGGADTDRLHYLFPLIQAGFHVALYGGYWKRFPKMRNYAKGQADPQTLRKAIGGSKVALCLVRRANRDGHSMRTFELAASGACILAENTAEHRGILGEDGEAAIYFTGVPQMIQRLSWLLEHPADRERLALAARRRITSGANTYSDRLVAMLGARVESLQ